MREYLTQQQIIRLIDSVNSLRDELLIRVQYETGCSVSELILIGRGDVKHNGIQFADRLSRTSNSLISLCKKYLTHHRSDYLFPSRQSQHMTVKRVQQIVKKYIIQLKFSVDKKSPHLLRYTHIIHATQQHIGIRAIMQQTGLGELRVSQIINELAPPEEDAYGRMFS